MWLIKRVKQDGYSLEDATAEAEAIGLRSDATAERSPSTYLGAGQLTPSGLRRRSVS